MGKKVLGLAVTVALLMVVLSGCFLLPKPDTVPPTVSVVFPQNNGNIVVTSASTSITVKASVTAHSPIQSVTFTLSSPQYPQIVVDAQGKYGETSGVFTYTFTDLKPGTYTLTVKAYSSARFPGRATTMFNITTAVQNPIVGAITVDPNYHGHYITKTPITFSANVTNPNVNGALNVTGTVNGETADLVSANNGVYTFKYTPNQAGTYEFKIVASLTVGTETYVGSNSTKIAVDEKPEVTITASPADYSVATSPVSFVFTGTSGVKACLKVSVNGSAVKNIVPYTSGKSINSYLAPDKWNEVLLTFEDKWGNSLPKQVKAHILGTEASNPNDTPYVFLIDKKGHVVNTNDWIHVNAGEKIDLYGYILKGNDPINEYDIFESYYMNENLTTPVNSGLVLSGTNLNADKVPLRLVAYLFDEQASDTFVKFDINVNNSAAAFLRYDVAPVKDNSVSVDVSAAGDTYEGAPATVDVTVESSQPIISIELDQPFKVGTPFDGYATTTAYSTKVISFTRKLIAPVEDVESKGIAAYGTTSGTFPFNVAFYGPSGEYQIGATVTAIANQSAYATTTYMVQADTSAPTIEITRAGSCATIDNVPVYYGPMKVVATVTDDHAIYWAEFASSNATIAFPTIVNYPNDSSIKNYGVKEKSTTATVTFNETGPFTIWAVASDKHFDPSTHINGNTANSITSIKGVYDDNAPSAKLVGGKYDIDVTSEYYSFTIEATDGNGVGLANTADVKFYPIDGGTPASATAKLEANGNTYNVVVDTSMLVNKRYAVDLLVKDKLYDLIPSSATALRAEHIAKIDTGYITVNHTYPTVALYNVDGNTETALGSGSTPVALTSDVFRIKINDPNFQWSWVDASNYKSYLKISLYGPNYGFEPLTKLVKIVHQTDSATGFFDVEIPEVYFNAAEGTNTVATSTIQVDVYNSVQDDKALFGRAIGKFIPASLFAAEGEPIISFNSKQVSLSAENSTPVVVPDNPSDFNVTFTLNGMANKEGMSLTFYANDTKIGEFPASNTDVTLSVPINPDWQTIKFWVRYAPSSTRTFSSVSVSNVSAYGYHYDYTIGTAKVLGDTKVPSATISVNGISVNSTITTSASLEYAVKGVAFYRHNDLTKYATALGNTTINGQVLLTTASTSSVFATATLSATETLSDANFKADTPYTVLSEKLAQATEAGIYTISFTANDPFRSWHDTKTATVVVDLAAPVLTTAVNDATSGVVPTIADGDTLTVSATDDTGVESVSGTITNLIYNVSNSLTPNLSNSGTGAFNVAANATVTLPTYAGAEFQNLPYEVTFSAKDIAKRSANKVTRLFVTNVDHNPEVSRFILQAPNRLLVRLPEPMWVEAFNLFTAYSTTFGGTITSANIVPVRTIASYEGHDIANEFVVTFSSSSVWSDPVGTNEWGDLSNVKMLDAENKPIKDLAGNVFVVPVSHTIIPPTLNVTPTATYYVGANQPVTYTIVATSSAGIKQTVGYFSGQTKVLNTPTGQLTFTSPNLTNATKTYNATFVTTDKSLDANQATVTRVVFVNAKKPSVSMNASNIIAANATLTVTGMATVGDAAGANVIKNIVVENTTNGTTFDATFNEASTTIWTATLTGLNVATNTIKVTVTDKYGNVNSTSTTVYVDNSVPTITVKFEALNNNGNISDGSSETIYVATPASFTWSVTTDSGTDATVKATITGLASGSSDTSSTVAIPSSSIYTISIVATNPISKREKIFTATRTVVIDNTPPTVSVATPATVMAASSTAIATYTATDAHFKSAYLKVSDANGKLYSTTVDAPVQNATVNLFSYLGGINGATVTVTITATDLAGNDSSTSGTFYVDTVNPTIKTVAASETGNATYIYIYFSEPVATTSSFSPNNIVFTYNTTTYVASDITFTANATYIVVKDFTTGLSAADLPAADWTVTVGNNVTDIVGNPVSGTGTYNNQ